MELVELYDILLKGEDSKNQFKQNFTNSDSLAAEMVAFSNSDGGRIFIGVADDGAIAGLSAEDVRRLNMMISNVASQHVHPAINPMTENILTDEGSEIIVVAVPVGLCKPYSDNQGIIWVKSGADKRKVTAREELQRMFQEAGLVYADEVPVNGLTATDIDLKYFSTFFEKLYGESVDAQQKTLLHILENMNLAKDGFLNVAGALLFSRNVKYKLPLFIVKAVHYPGTDIDTARYEDSRDFSGLLEEVYTDTLSFILSNVPYRQNDQNVNSTAVPVVAKTVWEELLSNALFHRDYFVAAPVRLFMFSNRVELVSPGHLPNNLTIENIKAGNSVSRNPILTSYGSKILPYRGLGNGIRRALKLHKKITFVDDRAGNQFKAIVFY
ncbi:MAG: putative DNA binding domain-containing protein [Spirochaetia bacterium]|jgi:ATP-dependent DNA helicase RecG|nr:putative DNA binding domain-containing protein [Spirochaetia bacterium]